MPTDTYARLLSTNGAYINDTLIGKGNRRTLTHGDELSLVMSVPNRPDGTYNQPLETPQPF